MSDEKLWDEHPAVRMKFILGLVENMDVDTYRFRRISR